ncbi:hypothetical protein L6452_42295 [Arctium lappa]|uniref:Uncharacterized protein n=1 Tax=Arctium lappa TaxID=4217 RepID=A0ACB8XLY6_ARCLA|nr:hypothetical protein L6452_42295 [Arctium lappa]
MDENHINDSYKIPDNVPNQLCEFEGDHHVYQAIEDANEDETARLNYKEFGDTISFDATYRKNKHAMVFVPFVAIDNHKRTVVVGASLIRGETGPYFTWILNAFMKAHGSQPKFVITNQCLGMKQAIPIVFPDAKHRLCMWHITKKFPDKVKSYP